MLLSYATSDLDNQDHILTLFHLACPFQLLESHTFIIASRLGCICIATASRLLIKALLDISMNFDRMIWRFICHILSQMSINNVHGLLTFIIDVVYLYEEVLALIILELARCFYLKYSV